MATHSSAPEKKLTAAPKDAEGKAREANGREIQTLQAGTRSAIRHLFIFVGGSGLETLDAMSPVLKANKIRFGDESLADSRGIVPYAIFVDTNTQETRMVRAADDLSDEEKQRLEKEGRLLRDVQGMGVETCDLYEKQDTLMAKLRRLRISLKSLTTGSDISPDSHGAKTDPRISRLLYLARRKEKSNSNPVHLAREIAEGWRDPHKKPLDNTVFLTVVGGGHGGTGPLALPLMVDIRRALEDVLSGTKSSLVSERFTMTAESAGWDDSVKQDRYEQRHRMLNTAMTVIAANHAHLSGKYAMTPTESVDMGFKRSQKHYEFIVGGDNGSHHVHKEGGHYEPTRVIGKFLASRLITTDPTSGLRAGVDKYLETGRNPKTCVLGEARTFSSLGVSELVPDPERKVLSKAKKQLLFAEACGVTIPPEVLQYVESTSLVQSNADKQADIQAKISVLFPDKFLPSRRTELKTEVSAAKISMQPTRYWDGQTSVEAAVAVTAGNRKNKLRLLTLNLSTVVDNMLQKHIGQLMDSIIDGANSLKQQHGLSTTIEFLQETAVRIKSLITDSKNSAERGKTKENTQAQQSEGFVDSIEDIKIPSSPLGKFAESVTNVFGLSSQQQRQQQISSLLNQLAASDNELLDFKGDDMYYTRFEQALLTVVEPAINRYLQDLNSQRLKAEEILNDIEADPETTVVSTPFDVSEPVDMFIDVGQAKSIRSKYLQVAAKPQFNPETDGDLFPWSGQDMQSISLDLSIRLKPSDINLIQKLQYNGAALLEKLEVDSAPLSCSASSARRGQSPGSQHPIVMITKPAVDRTEMASIPSPESGGTDIRVPPDGAYSIIREHHGFAFLDDKCLRECVELLLETPATAADARKMAETVSATGGESSELDFISREELGLHYVEKDLLLPVFVALARRKKGEAGEIGDTPKCANNNCGVMFYRTIEEKAEKIIYCPGCQSIYGQQV